jgi:hypothetical protein
MRRRLPLLGVAAASGADAPNERVPGEWARVALAPGSIGIADTGSGELAAALAVALGVELRQQGSSVALVLLGFQGVPSLPLALAARARAAGLRICAHAVDPTAEPALLPAGLVFEPGEVALWVGVPALSAFAPALAILLGADRSPLQWPKALRQLRAQIQLELGTLRPGLAATLASSLKEHGFLLRR